MPYRKQLLFLNKKITIEIEPFLFAESFPKNDQKNKKTYRLKIQSNEPLSELEQKKLNTYLHEEGFIEEAFNKHPKPPNSF